MLATSTLRTVSSLREVRRALLYSLIVGDRLEYAGATVERQAFALIVSCGQRRERFPSKRNYASACDEVCGYVNFVISHPEGETEAKPAPEPEPATLSSPANLYHGVCCNPRSANRPWIAQCYLGPGDQPGRSRYKYLGGHRTAIEAAEAYDAYVRKEKLDKPLNFPNAVAVAS